MEPLELPTQSFSVETMQSKVINTIIGDKVIKDYNLAIDYINQYYFEIERGVYYFYNVHNETFEFRDKKEFKNEAMGKLDSKSVEKYYTLNSKIYHSVSFINKPRRYKENENYYINHCHGIIHKTYLPFNDYSEDIKTKVKRMINMYCEVFCNKDDALLNGLLKYYACLIKGIKTKVIIYNQTEDQGVGKSQGVEFIRKFVIGEKLCLISSTEPLLSNNNKIFMGKLLVIFEELPTFSTSQWSAVSSKLKTISTESRMMFRDLYEKSSEGDNICNLWINTNVESIKDSDGRRIKFMPISNIHQNDFVFWKSLIDDCYNLNVGEAFYSYLMELDIKDFISQRDIPDCEKKQIAISNLLSNAEKFLKYNLLNNVEIGRIKPKDLYNQYIGYCQSNKLREEQSSSFHSRLEKLGIKSFKSGTMYYEIHLPQLKELAEKEKWLCKYDEYEGNDNEDTDNITILRSYYNEILEKSSKYDKIIQDKDNLIPIEMVPVIKKIIKKKKIIKPDVVEKDIFDEL